MTGTLTYIPGLYNLRAKFSKGLTWKISAKYRYSVWLRHLSLAFRNGMASVPRTLVEVGPGWSIGLGSAALLSGANKYYGLDLIQRVKKNNEIRIFDELVELFKRREPIPNEGKLSKIKPSLESYDFPNHILTGGLLRKSLNPERIKSIRDSLSRLSANKRNNNHIYYLAPWHNQGAIIHGSIDMILSHDTLEHTDNLDEIYRCFYEWLKPNCFMSHQIDFKPHDTTDRAGSHWSYSDIMWKLVRGKRKYLLNREPYSTHINLLNKFGFKIINNIKTKSNLPISRKKLAVRFKNLSDEDLVTEDALIQAVKK